MTRRDLGDVQLTADTTLAQLVATWGPPRAEGPAGEIAEYRLDCDARLWLSFEPSGERRLVRATLLTGAFVPEVTVIIDRLDLARRRSCDQLGERPRASARRIAETWGPPDNEVGSGIVRWTYAMADGGIGQVFPERDGLRVSCSRAAGASAD